MLEHTSELGDLRAGQTVQIRPRGHSVQGKVNSLALVTVAPYDPALPIVGEVTLVLVAGHDYHYLIKAFSRVRFLIGNNQGSINGWVGPQAIYGKATTIEQ